jgi:hypothetical protein
METQRARMNVLTFGEERKGAEGSNDERREHGRLEGTSAGEVKRMWCAWTF